MAEYEPTYGASPSYDSYSTSHDEIETGHIPLISDPIVIAAGQKLPRGAQLGMITATKKHVLSLPTANDGSEVPTGILAHGVDATAGDVKSAQYVFGQFIFEGLTFGAGWTFDTVKAAWAGTTRFLVKAA
jgi:hypothetical protein